MLLFNQKVREQPEPREIKKMKNLIKVIESMMVIFGAVLFGFPVVSLIAAPMALANLVFAVIMVGVFAGMAIFTIKTIN